MSRGALVAFLVVVAPGCVTGPTRLPSAFDRVTRQSPIFSAGPAVGAGDSASSGERVVGCADVRVQPLLAAVPKTSIALAFEFENRCHHAIRIALQNAEVVATWPDGTAATLALLDPEGRVHAPVLDARSRGFELLQFDAPPSAPAGPAQSICVDVSSIADAPEIRRAVPPICVTRRAGFANVDTLVGHGHMSEEGWQRLPLRWLLEVGFAANYLDLHGVTWSGKASSGQSFRFDASPLGAAVAYVMDLRVLPWVAGPLYTGGMIEFGVGPTPPNMPFVVADTPVRSYASLGDFAAGAVAGVVAGRSDYLGFRFDVTAGARFILSDLVPPGCEDERCPWDVWTVRPLVEPRVVLDAWLSPWWSISTWLDADVLYLPSLGAGLSATFHLWGYDGVR
jgi:hypothetical protein